MLFTSCPRCRTTFRITVETLHKADGKVRCGECERIFNALDTLYDKRPSTGAQPQEEPAAFKAPEQADATSESPRAEADERRSAGVGQRPGTSADSEPAVEALSEAPDAGPAAAATEPTEAQAATEASKAQAATEASKAQAAAEASKAQAAAEASKAQAAAEAFEAQAATEAFEAQAAAEASEAQTAAEASKAQAAAEAFEAQAAAEASKAQTAAEASKAQAGTEPSEAEAEPRVEPRTAQADETVAAEPDEELESLFSEVDVDEVLSFDAKRMSTPWSLEATDAKVSTGRGWWATAASIALLALLAQATHHFRERLVSLPYLGPGLEFVYAELGRPLPTSWNPDEFEIVNWATTAEDGADEGGNLHFTARILNRGRASHPMPLVYLELTDRWEQTIGSRYFRPDEYLTPGFSATDMLPPQGVADVRLDLRDPGPGAYGFEVDVCVEIDADVLRCKSDRVNE